MGWTSRTYLLLVSTFLILGLSCSSDEDALPQKSDYDFPEGKVFFDTPPLDLTGVMFFEPMGLMGVFPKDHGGFHHVELGVPEPLIPIYAMADGQIRGLGKSGLDFWVDIKYSTTISTKLGHVGRFEDFILEETGTLIEGRPQENIQINVKKGQIIGYVSSFSALDIGLHDQGRENSFCYPQLFWFETLFASNIFNYFNDPVKSELLAKAIRQQEPRGGKVDYDVRGTLAGNWFIPGGTDRTDFGKHFAIGYDHIHADRITIFDGYARFAEDNFTYFHSWVKNNGPLPETVDLAHGVVKYELIQKRWVNRIDDITWELSSLAGIDEQTPFGVFLFEMLDTETMQAEYFSDKLANEVSGFSGNQRIYVRNP